VSAPDTPDQSPSLLAGPPKRGLGVRRLNKLPIVFAAGAAMLVAAAIGYTYRDRLMRAAANATTAASHRPEPGNGAAVLNGAPVGGEVIPAVARSVAPPSSDQSPPTGIPSTIPTDRGAGGGQPQEDDKATKARREAWQAYYAQLAQLRKDRLAAASSAMTSDTGMGGSGGQNAATGAGIQNPASFTGAAPGGTNAAMGGDPGVAGNPVSGGFGLPIYPPARVDGRAQREKQAFLNQPGDVTGGSDDLQAVLHDPSSPFLVMTGTAIPAVMIGGINSDMPGMVIGQVSENVYDTATGRYLLIPQGARLIGAYDNMVANGQTRVGVIWNRIIYPDAESIDLGSMEGADQGGYAGFHDQVNTHFWSKLGDALLISVAGAAVQLSQGTGQTTNGYNSQQIAAASLGQQFGELGQEYARAGLSIPNTLEIRPGYRFVVMVNKDMHLRPYVDARNSNGATAIRIGPIMQ
jgi:type IV secretory pathway VirB10-like protein